MRTRSADAGAGVLRSLQSALIRKYAFYQASLSLQGTGDDPGKDHSYPNIKMRQIHESQKGFICPCETPEGKTVGITKSLAWSGMQCSVPEAMRLCRHDWMREALRILLAET